MKRTVGYRLELIWRLFCSDLGLPNTLVFVKWIIYAAVFVPNSAHILSTNTWTTTFLIVSYCIRPFRLGVQ